MERPSGHVQKIHTSYLCSGSESGSGSTVLTCFWASRIRIHRIHMFLDLPDPLVRGMDPDPFISKQK
jgi:hypothetical protein